MKILIDARLYGLENAGLGRYLINLIKELAILDNKNNYVVLLRKKYFDTLNLPQNWKKILADYRHYSFAEQIKIPGIIKNEKPDITHFPHFNVPLFFRGKYVVTIHDMLMHRSIGLATTTLPLPIYLIKRLAYRTVFDSAVKRSAAILVPTKTVRNEVFKKYNIDINKIFVTYEGVDEKVGNESLGNLEKPYFVYAGNAYPHKNLDNLIKSIKILNTNNAQKVFLAIASSRNIFTQRVEKRITELNATEFVKILGFVADSKLGSLFKNSVGFVFPSFSEGFGLPGLEALSSGTLLLASDINVFKEVFENHALYFDPVSPKSIADTMKMALSISPSDRKKKIESSIQFVKKYSWAKMAKETLKIYASCNSIRQS